VKGQEEKEMNITLKLLERGAILLGGPELD
jgi:hypothetical protein